MTAASNISCRINAERLMLVAWLRAILLQLAHPLIAAGVADHSSFRGGATTAIVRLHHTVSAMLALTFGNANERERALDAIRAIHRRVNGTLRVECGPFAAGTRYSAEDPALLVWVHATLVDSIVLVYEKLVAPVTADERDRFCADSADVAVALGAPPDLPPRSWSALRTYMDEQYASGQIVVSSEARRLASSVLMLPGSTLIAAGLLPAAMRRQYGLPWDDGRERRFRVLMKLFGAARRLMPTRLAHWKAARSLKRTEAIHEHPAIG